MDIVVSTKEGVEVITLTPEEEAVVVAEQEAKRIEDMQRELETLQSLMASKGLYWLLKYLVQTGVSTTAPNAGKLNPDDIPQKLKDAQARIDEIEGELNG